MDQDHNARVAALSILQACACARLLRANGRNGHAVNLEAAIKEVTKIVSDYLGGDSLAHAMEWANDQLWEQPEAIPPLLSRRTLH
jgi:hypothetical protein